MAEIPRNVDEFKAEYRVADPELTAASMGIGSSTNGRPRSNRFYKLSMARRWPSGWHGWVLTGLACALGAWAVLGSMWIEPNLSSNADEHTYAQQAWTVAHGRLSVPSPQGKLASAFRPWFAIPTAHHGWVLKYNVVWPAVLAMGDAVGVSRLGLGLAAVGFVLGLFLLAEAVLESRSRALLATGFVVLAPLTIVQSTTVLSYISFGALWTLAAACLVRGSRSHRPIELAGAGFLSALAIIARPFDGVVVLAPFYLWGAWVLWRTRRHAAPVRSVGIVAAAFAPVGIAQLAYDKVVTGSWLTMPFSRWSPKDGLGFGQRGLNPDGSNTIHFGPRDGIRVMRLHIQALNGWSLGGVVLLVLAVLGFVQLYRRRVKGSVPLALVAFAIPVGYVFGWGALEIATVYRDRYGPFYVLPVLVPLAVFAAEGIAFLWSRWRVVSAVALCAMVPLSAITLDRSLSVSIAERDATNPVYRLLNRAEHRHDPSLVLLPGAFVGHLIHNRFSHGLGPGTHVLYAIEPPGESLPLVTAFPKRTPYRLLPCGSFPSAQPGVGLVPSSGSFRGQLIKGNGARLVQLHIVEGSSISLGLNLPPIGSLEKTYIDVSAGTMGITLTPEASARSETILVTITPSGITASGPAHLVKSGTVPAGALSVRVTAGPDGQPVYGYAWDAPATVGPDAVRVLAPAVATRYIEHPGVTEIMSLCSPPGTLDISSL
jgi:hypothetical protein